MKYTPEDLEFARNEYNKIKLEAISYSHKDNETKKEFILRLKDKAKIIFEYEERDLHGLSVFIFEDLNAYKFSIDTKYYSTLFSDDEKRKYIKSGVTPDHEHIFNDVVEGNPACECGAVQLQGYVYTIEPEQPKTTKEIKDKAQQPVRPDPFTNPNTEYLQRIKDNCSTFGNLNGKLINKFYVLKDKKYVISEDGELMSKYLHPDINEQKSIQAQLKHLEKQLDYRAKVGEFEKLKARILEKALHLSSHVAKLLGITPKHMTNDIMKDEHPQSGKKNKIFEYLKWFKTFYYVLPKDMKKGERLEILMSDWYDKQICRKQLDMEQELRCP